MLYFDQIIWKSAPAVYIVSNKEVSMLGFLAD